MPGLLLDFVIAWAAVGGICAGIFGFREWATYLIAPAAIQWLLWPLVSPLLGSLDVTAIAHWWLLLPALLLAPVVAVILGMRLFVSVIHFFFGARVAGHVGGVFVTRLLDWVSGRRRGRPIPHLEDREND